MQLLLAYILMFNLYLINTFFSYYIKYLDIWYKKEKRINGRRSN